MESTYRGTQVYLIDDHPIVLEGVRALIAAQGDFVVAGAASNPNDAIIGIERKRPQIVVLDGSLRLHDGSPMLSHLLHVYPGLLVVGLTLHEEGTYAREFLRTGARGFVLKRSAADDLLKAMRIVRAGGTYIDPAVASSILASDDPVGASDELLSQRELDVVQLVAKGFSNKDAARSLGLSVKTIETYRARACSKLDIHSRAGLVRHAIEHGWLSAHPA